MAQPVPPLRIVIDPPLEPKSTLSSKLKKLAEIVVQIAIRILFVIVCILMAAALTPLSMQWIVIPIVAIGSTMLAAFFYPEPKPPPSAIPTVPLPLYSPSQIEVQELSVVLPGNAPRGIKKIDKRLNCVFNALIHFIESDSEAARLLRVPSFEVYPTLIPLRKALYTFLTAYDRTLQNGRSIVVEDSQMIRKAVHEVNHRISKEPMVHEDASEVLDSIFCLLPDTQKMHIIETRNYSTEGLPKIDGLPSGISQTEESYWYFSLAIEENNSDLAKMFEHYCNDHTLLDRRCVKEREDDPQTISYQTTITRVFVEAPTALRFMIKRFDWVKSAESWLTHCWPSRFPKIPDRFIKKNDLIEVPNEMTIVLQSGEKRVYRLAGFVNQHGDSLDSGHYTASRMVDGRRYFINDDEVTLEDQAAWNERLRRSYLLCYLPAPE